MKFGGVYVFEGLKEKNIEKKKRGGGGEEEEEGKEQKMQKKRRLIGISFILWPNSLEQLSS